jgi:RNA polymerase sigma-70 factor (ECF subfamily)
MQGLSTQALVERLSVGDEDAFKAIYERYWEKLFRICVYYTHSQADSEDLLIGIFMSLWNNRSSVIIEHLESYLIKAAKNQSYKYLLQQQRKKKQLHAFQQTSETATTESLSPETLMVVKELDLQIQSGVKSLPEKTQRIFLLNREKGLTYQEIARVLGISVKTVEYHISKALSALGKYILLLLIILRLS